MKDHQHGDDSAGLQFNVDVALNGQQFTGRPLQFRYYDIHVDKIDPSIGSSEGGTVINVSISHSLINFIDHGPWTV